MNTAAQEGPGCASGEVLATSFLERGMLGLALPRGTEGLSNLEITGPSFWQFTALQLSLSAALQSLLFGFELWSFTHGKLWP